MYPTATADCVAHFQQAHPQDWRHQFQDPDQILAYLERRRIHIITRKREEHQIRFELKAYEETTVTAFHFSDHQTALYPDSYRDHRAGLPHPRTAGASPPRQQWPLKDRIAEIRAEARLKEAAKATEIEVKNREVLGNWWSCG